MITIRTGTYTKKEKQELCGIFCDFQFHLCEKIAGYARTNTSCRTCEYRNICRDLGYVVDKYKSDNK